MSDMTLSTAIDILVPIGTIMLTGDEFFDSDTSTWVKVPEKMLGKVVGRRDVIKRATFNLARTVRDLLAHLELLRGHEHDQSWWDGADPIIREARRRLGVKTIHDYQREQPP